VKGGGCVWSGRSVGGGEGAWMGCAVGVISEGAMAW
jgi:hypothetical protein